VNAEQASKRINTIGRFTIDTANRKLISNETSSLMMFPLAVTQRDMTALRNCSATPSRHSNPPQKLSIENVSRNCPDPQGAVTYT
jgi:hypothetical protein